MPQPTTSPLPLITQVVEDTMHTMTQGIETTVKAGFDLQQALVESTMSVMRASFAVNKTAVEQWMALSKQRQPGLISALENNLQTWAGVVERTVAVAEVAVDRATADTERMAKEAEAAVRQHERETERERVQWEQELEESRQRGERQQREPAHEPQTPAPQAAEIPAINVVKREREDDWAVVRDNASRASATYDTKREAVERARELAQRNGADVHVETATSINPDGQKRERASDEPQAAAPQAAEIPAINVVKREDDWAVVRDNASRPSATFDTKREAMKRARELAQRSGADVHVETDTSTHPERNGARGARQHEGGAAKA